MGAMLAGRAKYKILPVTVARADHASEEHCFDTSMLHGVLLLLERSQPEFLGSAGPCAVVGIQIS